MVRCRDVCNVYIYVVFVLWIAPLKFISCIILILGYQAVVHLIANQIDKTLALNLHLNSMLWAKGRGKRKHTRSDKAPVLNKLLSVVVHGY